MDPYLEIYRAVFDDSEFVWKHSLWLVKNDVTQKNLRPCWDEAFWNAKYYEWCFVWKHIITSWRGDPSENYWLSYLLSTRVDDLNKTTVVTVFSDDLILLHSWYGRILMCFHPFYPILDKFESWEWLLSYGCNILETVCWNRYSVDLSQRRVVRKNVPEKQRTRACKFTPSLVFFAIL